MIYRTILRSALPLVATLLMATSAQAQLFRAYVASTGSDANPCNLPAPCRLLPAALAAVADGGEIWMLDSANYNTGTVNVTKSVSILAIPGAVGSVVASGGSAINIATASVKVSLRNLVIVPLPGAGGTSGISMTNGAALTVENCLIANLPLYGIVVATAADVRITDTTIRGGSESGLYLLGGARGTVTRSVISGNSPGVVVEGSVASTTTTADIADSTLDGNNHWAVYGVSSSATAAIKVSVVRSRLANTTGFGRGADFDSQAGASIIAALSDNIISNNANWAVGSLGTGSRVLVSGNTISGNDVGLQNGVGGSVLESAGNNAVRNNNIDAIGTITAIPTM